LKKGKEKMRLDWEVAIWSLDTVRLTDSSDFIGHSCLVIGRADMFNCGIRENDIELSVGKLRHRSPIPDDRCDTGLVHWVSSQIEQGDMKWFVDAQIGRHACPILRPPTNVQNLYGPREVIKHLQENFESLTSQPRSHGIV
jgi:hypothetical protein